MAEKRFKITTSKKQFDVDWINRDLFKTENGICYAREKTTDDWAEIKTFEKRTRPLEKWDDVSWFFGIILYIGGFILLYQFAGYYEKIVGVLVALWVYLGIGVDLWLGELINKILTPLPSYYEQLSNKETKKIIESNTWRSEITTSSKSYKNYSSRSYSGGGYSGGGSGGARSGSYSGGSSGGGYSEYSGNYISSSDLDKALKVLESDGKDWNKLANSTTDEERENLFSQYFKNEQKGKAANDKFNREQVWPARTETLNNILNEAEYEDETTKENLNEKIRQFDSEISNEDFQKTAREIRKYQERKKLKDNHVKYEGRLSNKDVKAIKEYHGYVCMGCGLDPLKEYGAEMKGILEAHHKKPWAEIKENEIRTVKPDDFYILCPNCHRMIHKLNSPDDLNSLREVLNQNKKFH